MNRLASPRYKNSPFVIVAVAFLLYVVVFAVYHHRVGDVLGSLAVIPVVGASWYFGVRWGLLTAFLSVLSNEFVHILSFHSFIGFHLAPSTIIGMFALFFIALAVGRLGTVTRERSNALLKLEGMEKERQARVDFLHMLSEITKEMLKANDLGPSTRILLKDIAQLFGADDCYFAFWDSDNQLPIPMAAYGSMSDIYPHVKFEPGERTLTASVIKAGQPLAIEDVENSTLMSKKAASIFPNHSMLGLPLITQDYRPAVLIMGFNERRKFDGFELARAEIVAQHIALVLAKMQLLEDARRQIKQLTILHKVSLLSTEAKSEDQLIERVTDIIGQSLFPDNFGMMFLDEKSGILCAHPSYRFFSNETLHMIDIPVGVGVTGQVAKMGQPLRVGNVHEVSNYVGVDKRTVSELCVPIKHQEHVLGVINAESTKRSAFTEDDERLLVTLAGQLATAIEQLRTAQAERHWLDQLAHSNDLIYSFAHITTHIEKALSPDEIIQILGAELEKINLTCLLAVYDLGKQLFTLKYTSIKPEIIDQLKSDIGLPLINYSFPLHRMNSILDINDLSQPKVVSSPEDEIQILFAQKRERGISKILQKVGISAGVQLLRLPLLFEENLLGILWIWGKDIMKTDLPVLSIFAKQIGISLERARLFQEVQNLALTDPLTGLYNRRALFELSRMEFSRAERTNRPISCMMLDLDHFKEINDNFGHQTGDHILQEFARRCKHAVRDMDLVGRYGGEELLIVLPETDITTALQIAERTRSTVAAIPMKVADRQLRVTVSIGVSSKDENTEYLETLIARADQAMYIAKHKGRDRVAVSK
jgi:diguanylate cyclase (GGDEF)-like protein